MPDKTDLVLEILSDVLEVPPDQRDALINKACNAQPPLRAEVERLLQLGQGPDAHNFLDLPPRVALRDLVSHAGLGAASDDPDSPALPRFDRYHALRLIAEGGMGTVYEAEQDNPRRHVALKVIKAGMDTKQVIARFDLEREALALMDHPNIAAVYDAGVTDSSRPFFVMELVKGVAITEYCDTHALSIHERLHLVIPVCKAVQHAHQKGIIHRDLKPSNVLVTLVDGTPVPKVIDFGIVKATTGQRLTDQTLLTEYREFIGTPQYMSPEQADITRIDIDTRSDVYSLGVLLYELLTGATPFDRDQLSAANPEQMRRVIREAQPPRPSTRLRTMLPNRVPDSDRIEGASSLPDRTTIAKSRRTDPAILLKTFRGELDWIVMKCLEKDRTRRYDTPNELAADLDRYLRNQPVHAAAPSTAYRLRKFFRRNRAALAVSAVLALSLIGGIAGTTLGMLRAWAAQQDARRDADEAAALNDVLLDMFRAGIPDAGGDRNLKVADLFEGPEFNFPQKLHEQVRKYRARRQADLASIVSQPADTYQALLRRALAHAGLGQFHEAAADYDACIKLDPSNFAPWHARACLLAYLGQPEAYEAHCRDMLPRFADSTVPFVPRRAARAALLRPRSPDQYDFIFPIVDRKPPIEQGPEYKWFQASVRALAAYRAGQFDLASGWLNEVRGNGSPSPMAMATTDLLLSMSHHQLNHKQEAQAAFERARQIMRAQIPSPGTGGISDANLPNWLICHVLHREAKALLAQ